MTPVDVGSRITLEQSLISRTAQRLYEKRLITRRRSRTDRRNVTLRVTSEGEELARQLEQPLQNWRKIWREEFPRAGSSKPGKSLRPC